MSSIRAGSMLRCLRAIDVAAMTVAFGAALAVSGQYAEVGGLDEFFAVRIKLVNFLFFGLYVLIWQQLFRSLGLYTVGRYGLVASEWWAIAKAVGVGTFLMSGLGLVLNMAAVNGRFLATFFVVGLVGTILARGLARLLLGEARRKGRCLRNLVIVGCGPRGTELGRRVRRKPELGYLLLGYIDDMPPPANPLHEGGEKLLGSLARAGEILAGLDVDEVVVNLPIKSYYETISKIVALCEDLGVTVRIPADFFGSRLVHAYSDEIDETPLLTLRMQSPPLWSLALKRVMDVVGSVASLILLSPLLMLIAVAIKVDSRGAVLFVQQRVGLRRRRFDMVKFRTMCVDAEARQRDLEPLNEIPGAAFKIKNDPRITRVGAVLRRWSLDELPQLWNVLTGDMSLVGPRPLPLRDVERLDREWQERRFSVKPGLTCLWQMNGRHSVGFDEWMELDLEYIDSWSLSLDLDILLRTVPAVLKGTGAS